MGSQPTQKLLYRFGPFSLNPNERLLLRENEPLALTPKAFDLLVMLVANAGHLLEKDLLMRQLWSDAFVEEANLSNNISLLRKTLNAGIDAEYIETVPRRGYRFCAAVTVGDSSDRGIPPASISPAFGPSPDLAPNRGWPVEEETPVRRCGDCLADQCRRGGDAAPCRQRRVERTSCAVPGCSTAGHGVAGHTSRDLSDDFAGWNSARLPRRSAGRTDARNPRARFPQCTRPRRDGRRRFPVLVTRWPLCWLLCRWQVKDDRRIGWAGPDDL